MRHKRHNCQTVRHPLWRSSAVTEPRQPIGVANRVWGKRPAAVILHGKTAGEVSPGQLAARLQLVAATGPLQ